jgi:hypothetical protein
MRLASCLVVEGALAVALLGGGIVGGVRAVHEARAVIAGRRAHQAPQLAAARSGSASSASFAHSGLSHHRLAPRQELSGEGALEMPEDSPGTFLGMSDELLLERLRTQPVARLKLNRGGSSLSFRVDFSDGSRAAWKPAQTNAQTVPRKEVAAYRLNRLLGLNAVAPATQRSISRDDLFGLLDPDSLVALPRIRAETIVGPNGLISGEASYWIPVIKDSLFDTPAGHAILTGWLTQGQPIPFEQRGLVAQVARLVVFDFLIANPDRYSGGNMKTSEDGSQLFFMDNTMSFFLDADGPEKTRLNLYRTQRFSRGLHQALGQLDLRGLRRCLHEPDGTDILTDAELRAVLERRLFIERYVADLIKQFGEREVLSFP